MPLTTNEKLREIRRRLPAIKAAYARKLKTNSFTANLAYLRLAKELHNYLDLELLEELVAPPSVAPEEVPRAFRNQAT